MNPLQWFAEHDRDHAALRRAARTAIVMPALFALGIEVIGNAEIATFAAFGSFAMLLLVDFGGPMRDRLRAQLTLVVVGALSVCVATLAAEAISTAVLAMMVVGFAVIFAGVVSSVLAGATTSLLLAFILPVSLPVPVSALPDRLAGWAIAGAVSIAAIGLLWPAPTRSPLRSGAAAAARTVAARLRAEIAYLLSGRDDAFRAEHVHAIAAAGDAVARLQKGFLATPYRPTGLSTADRTVVRLVDELNWLNAIVIQSAPRATGAPVDHAACAVKGAAATVLERAADLLEVTGGEVADLGAALDGLTAARDRMEQHATHELPVRRLERAPGAPAAEHEPATEQETLEFITSLDPGFRAHELSYAASVVGCNVELTALAERRGWLDRVLGRQPGGLSGAFAAAQERASAHIERHSVWLHNSVRGAAGLGLAVLVATETGVQHSFWVVLGTLSVLRSNALNTGSNVVRGLLGTVVGFIVGAAILAAIGTNTVVLWWLLPPAILVAGVAPAVISFAAGQAGFTVTLVILFNIIQPAGWRIGLLRIEDIAIGCAVSLVVGLLFWPRGAGAAMRQALAEAYVDSAGYLAAAVEFGMIRCDAGAPTSDARPAEQAVRAAAASRRLDDTFRSFLAERGSKPLPLAEVTALVTGVTGLRLAADAVTELWARDDGAATGDRAAARAELLRADRLVREWYVALAGSLLGPQELPAPLPHDQVADGRLVSAVRHDLQGPDGTASATAIRMIWTGDHLDAVRRLQVTVHEPARTAATLRAGGGLRRLMTGWRRPRFSRAG